MKIPFDIKYRPQIESGEFKVETRDGRRVRIICWDRIDKHYPIIALVPYEGGESSDEYTNNGRYFQDGEQTEDDLFLITPEEELTEFEKKLWEVLKSEGSPIGPIEKFTDSDKEVFHSYAAELLALAREQFIKDGYVIEKKAFRDAVENISDKHRAEMSVEYSLHCKIEDGTRHAIMNWKEFQKVAQKFIDIGKAEALRTHSTELTENLDKSGLDEDSIPYHLIEFMCNLYDCQNWKEIEDTAELYTTRVKAAALKDLPRWRKCDKNTIYNTKFNLVENGVGRFIMVEGYQIDIDSLEKLPGFKEG